MVTCSVEKQVIKCGVEGGEGIGVGVRGEREGEGVDVNEREIGGRGGGRCWKGRGEGEQEDGEQGSLSCLRCLPCSADWCPSKPRVHRCSQPGTQDFGFHSASFPHTNEWRAVTYL